MVFARHLTLVLVKLAGRELAVILVYHCLVASMDIVSRHLNVFVTMDGVEDIVIFVSKGDVHYLFNLPRFSSNNAIAATSCWNLTSTAQKSW